MSSVQVIPKRKNILKTVLQFDFASVLYDEKEKIHFRDELGDLPGAISIYTI